MANLHFIITLSHWLIVTLLLGSPSAAAERGGLYAILLARGASLRGAAAIPNPGSGRWL